MVRSKHLCSGTHVHCFVALYAEMKEGLLSHEADYASKPLRDQLKRAIPQLVHHHLA